MFLELEVETVQRNIHAIVGVRVLQRKARSTMSSLRLDVLRDGAEKFDTWEIHGRGDQEKRTMLGEILRGRGG